MIKLYSEIRDNLKTGDLLVWKFSKIENIFDFLLYLYHKLFKATYIHVGIVVKLGNRNFVIEATPPISRLYPISLCRDFYLIQTNINTTEFNVNLLLSKIGIKYSILDYIRSIFKFKNSTTEDYCSDLASTFYNQIGYINDDNIGKTPDTLVKAITKITNKEPIFIKVDRGNFYAI